VIGDKPIAVITRDDMVTLRETLFAMPARLTVAQRSLPYPKIAATIRADQTTMTTGTIRKWFNMIEAAFHWAVSEQLLNKNPAIGVKPAKDKGQTRDTFSLDDIAIILNSSAVAGNFRPVGGAGEAAKWVPLIALYTGARLTEVGQLLLTDIKVEGAIHYFDFTTLDDDGNAVKTLKNATSRRRVPVHHKIIEAGFLDYLAKLRATRQRYLFPLLPHGNGDPRLVMKPWGKWWGRYSDTLGITSSRKPFHSTRHAFKRACRRAGIGKDVHSELTGHATSDVGDGYGRIDGMAFDLDTLDDAIQLVTYDR